MKKRPLLILLSGVLLMSGGLVSCNDTPANDTNLSVLPSESIAFAASDNADVVLTVTTDAESWDFTKPDWVTATKSGKTLTVNAQDNGTTNTRVGRLEITAASTKPVVINISQSKPIVTPGTDAVAGRLADKSGTNQVEYEIELNQAKIEALINFSIEKATAKAVDVEIFIDEAYLAEYNFMNDTDYKLLPESLVTIAGDGTVSIAGGSVESGDITVAINTESELIEYNTTYLLPLCANPKTTNVTIAEEDQRVNYLFNRVSPKEVKNVLYFEVNDTNPLNALEYVLADGQMFFDAVVLFAANINYNSVEDLVYLQNNPNVEMLLEGSETYLQPLRKKGIKVYLGILGNHDAAGVCQLSDWGAKEFAMTLANAVDVYKLDGVSFDDEYSGSPIIGNKWFTSKSGAAGARLCYETKKAMRNVCGEDKDVMVFYWGSLYSSSFTIIDGVEPKDYLDLAVANYGGAATPASSMTKKGCSGMSVELNLNRGDASESRAKAVKDGGYGWFMWFALDPNPASGIYNGPRSLPKLQAVARGLYDQELVAPQYYYKKVKDVSIDPTRYKL